ncbi:hypothetical protein POTOM_061042 [Populus tomentosa]|uniref:Uncharacterized protein n=1 Tax=Populus tomentosa TaxID=118781 RepID=A0A8X7XR92_POPTO|nr:hypothetical protein POTOM_061042 [Populus tomentosa]
MFPPQALGSADPCPSLTPPARTRIDSKGASSSYHGVRACNKGKCLDMHDTQAIIHAPPSLGPFRLDEVCPNGYMYGHPFGAHLSGSSSLGPNPETVKTYSDADVGSSIPSGFGGGHSPGSELSPSTPRSYKIRYVLKWRRPWTIVPKRKKAKYAEVEPEDHASPLLGVVPCAPSQIVHVTNDYMQDVVVTAGGEPPKGIMQYITGSRAVATTNTGQYAKTAGEGNVVLQRFGLSYSLLLGVYRTLKLAGLQLCFSLVAVTCRVVHHDYHLQSSRPSTGSSRVVRAQNRAKSPAMQVSSTHALASSPPARASMDSKGVSGSNRGVRASDKGKYLDMQDMPAAVQAPPSLAPCGLVETDVGSSLPSDSGCGHSPSLELSPSTPCPFGVPSSPSVDLSLPTVDARAPLRDHGKASVGFPLGPMPYAPSKIVHVIDDSLQDVNVAVGGKPSIGRKQYMTRSRAAATTNTGQHVMNDGEGNGSIKVWPMTSNRLQGRHEDSDAPSSSL